MIRIHHSSLKVAALTHPGMSGKNNEDRYAVSAYRLDRRSRAPVLLAVLSDGIGGHHAGEVAAEIAVERISQLVAASDGLAPVEILREAVTQASREILSQAVADLAYYGMGATCACAWVIGSQLYTAAVGDSRIYLLRGGGIYQLTTDHTWIQDALDAGIIQPDQAKKHPNAHVIRRYLGSINPPEVDFRLRPPGEETASEECQGLALLENDRLLLCSDGLTDLVEDQEILAALGAGSLESAERELIDLANQRGGHDNITLVAAEIPRRSLLERMLSSNKLFVVLVLGSVLLAGLLISGLWFGFNWLNFHGGEPTATPEAGYIQPTQGLPVTLPSQAPALSPGAPGTPTSAPAAHPTVTATPLALTQSPPADTAPSRATFTPWPTNTPAP